MPSQEIEGFIARVPGTGPALPLSDCGPAGAAMPGNWFAFPAPRRGSKILRPWRPPSRVQEESPNTLKALVLRRNPAGSSWVPFAPLSQSPPTRPYLHSGALNAKNAPESTICGVPPNRPTPTGSVLWLVPISFPRSAPRRVGRTNVRSSWPRRSFQQKRVPLLVRRMPANPDGIV